MTFYDITLSLDGQLAVWPGDTPVSVEPVLTIKNGETVNLGSILMSLHAGTHVDTPYHFDVTGETSDSVAVDLDVDLFCGTCLVVDVSGKETITCADLGAIQVHRYKRLLLKTLAWRDHTQFPVEIPTLAGDVPAYLQSCGVRLLGVDLPSVDEIHSKDLPNHHELYRCGITILESVVLTEVQEGPYELIALPLKVVGADAAPVRAILKEFSP